MTFEQTRRTQGRLRELNVSIVSGAICAVGSLLMAADADSWRDALLMGVSLSAALVVVNRWTVGRSSRVVLPGLIVTATVWLVGVLAADTSEPSYGFAIVATVTILELPRHRRAAIAGLAAFSAAVVGAKLALAREDVVDVLIQYVLICACVALGGVVLTVLLAQIHDLIGELEKAREREAEVAVMRERVRFAGDLHDIQGHTLHVVKLKVSLAKRLLHSDIGRVEQELEEVRVLLGDTINQTRELAYAQRRLNLSAELENAKNLFEAAGIQVRVDRRAEVDVRVGELLGQVLRETTTNILRHAEAEQVWITLAETGIAIVNDGALVAGPPGLSGLAALRDRLAAQEGELTVERKEGLFRTTATFPRLRRDAALATRQGGR